LSVLKEIPVKDSLHDVVSARRTVEAARGPARSAELAPSTAAGPSRRDLRADFFRGVTLLFILWNHVFWASDTPVPYFLQFTPWHWGFASSAEAFVFISGYVYGLVYIRVVDRHGTGAAFGKSLLRAWQLYVSNSIAMLLALGIVGLWASSGAGIPERTVEMLWLHAFLEPTPRLFMDLVRLHVVPWGFGTLALYMLLLLLAPIYIALVRKHLPWCIFLSLLLYAVAQLGINVPAQHSEEGGWYFNPFAWQLLFFVGIAIGARGWSIPRNRGMVLAAGTVILLAAIKVWLVPQLLWRSPELIAASGTLLTFRVPLTDVTRLEPVRLVHFLTLAYFVAALAPREARVWSSNPARPLILLGQHSLEVFCFGLVFTYLVLPFLERLDAGWATTVTASLIGWALSAGFALLLHRRRSLAWAPKSS
jgi:hypothetical protein